MSRAPLILIHGAFCGGWIFDAFKAPLEAAGHPCRVAELLAPRENPAGLSMADYARRIEALARAEAASPILIGHSLGGLAAQLAAMRVPVRGLILLAPSAPWGVTGVSVEEAISAVSLMGLGAYWLSSVEPDYATAHTYSLDRLDRAARKAAFQRMRAESGRALWETLNWWQDPFAVTAVDPTRIPCPVLALAGGQDRVHPPATVRRTAERLGGETQVFDAMSHWLPAEPGWEAVAAACLAWIARQEAVAA